MLPAAVVPSVAVVLAFLPQGPLRGLTWAAVALGCCALVARAPWPGPRRPWPWVAAGLVLVVVSGLLTASYVADRLPAWSFDPAVLLRLPAYVPLLVGAFWLTESARRPDRWAVVDALVVVLAGTVVGLLVVADGQSDQVPALVLPVLDVAVLAALLPVLSPRARGGAEGLLVAGLVALLLADTMLVLTSATGVSSPPAVGGLLLVSVLLVALAATHPAAGRLAEAALERTERRRLAPVGAPAQVTPRRLMLLGVGLVGAPVLLLVALLDALPETGRLVPVVALLVLGLAAVRLTHLVGELVRSDTEREAQQRFSSAFDRSPGGLGMIELGGREAGRLVEANASLSHLLGRPVEQLRGSAVASLVHPDDVTGALRLQLALAEVAAGRPALTPVPARLASPGRPRFVEVDIAPLPVGEGGGAASWAVLQVDDVTERLDTEAQLARAARLDPLTGLVNRVGLLESMHDALVDHARGGQPVVLLLLDLDRFKLVNDTHGHAVGDELLREVATRLCRLRVQEVARLGGDEFAMLARLPTGPLLDLLLRRVHGALEPLVTLSRGDVVVSASIGVVVRDASAGGAEVAGLDEDAESLIRQADIAMYRAKARGGHRHVLFGHTLQAEVDTRHAIERELRSALTNGGFSVVYQPVVDLTDLRVVSHEALVRLVRRVRGVTVGPAEFLEVAEESGLVRGMGGFVMATALGEASRDPHGRRMAVNVSGRELAEPDFAGRVLRRLNRADVPATRLTVEVTESAVVPYLDGVVPQLRVLRAEGVEVALDDFGTGYSSLTHLRALPVDVVKIDRSFVERVVLDGPDRRIVAAVTDLAAGLGLQTVAEGIETVEQHEAVTALGCRFGQGYLYGRPAADLLADAPVAQPAEAGALKAQQYGFESRRGHARPGGAVAAPRTGDHGVR